MRLRPTDIVPRGWVTTSQPDEPLEHVYGEPSVGWADVSDRPEAVDSADRTDVSTIQKDDRVLRTRIGQGFCGGVVRGDGVLDIVPLLDRPSVPSQHHAGARNQGRQGCPGVRLLFDADPKSRHAKAASLVDVDGNASEDHPQHNHRCDGDERAVFARGNPLQSSPPRLSQRRLRSLRPHRGTDITPPIPVNAAQFAGSAGTHLTGYELANPHGTRTADHLVEQAARGREVARSASETDGPTD